VVTQRDLLIPLYDTANCDEKLVGGKAAKLSRLVQAGYRVPNGFCVTASAYQAFVEESRIEDAIHMELGRKPLEDMRWEEIWDAALRIRSLFLGQPLSHELCGVIGRTLRELNLSKPLAVRSSALGEDSVNRSFAGLHESIIGVLGEEALGDAIRLVWASLWSDAALLYRRELGLDPARSRMAVLVQELVDADRSGVAFGRDPRDTKKEHAIIEAVPGRCSTLVDGAVDPDRWEIHRTSKRVVAWLPGEREDGPSGDPLLEASDLERILETLLSVENVFGWAPDVEWTGRSSSLTVLQARPITTARAEPDDKRNWYLTLRPGDERLRQLRDRVSGELIPELQSEGQRLAAEVLDEYGDSRLADVIEERSRSLEKWRKIYWDEFIPFAHGVRRLATYYNDAVRPEDPYEFVGLLKDQPLIAAQRNAALGVLADQLEKNQTLRDALKELLDGPTGAPQWETIREKLRGIRGSDPFIEGFEDLSKRFLDITCDHERLQDQPEAMLRTIDELSRWTDSTRAVTAPATTASELEERLLEAVGEERRDEATEWIETGRISWKLRDDDNLLLARVESQVVRALELATKRLLAAGRVVGEGRPGEENVKAIIHALRDSAAKPLALDPNPEPTQPTSPETTTNAETPRQLIGQPASPGLATGKVRCLRGGHDYGLFRHGEVLVCDAIQPTMTHLVPLACAIVERRGGMLIHGAIIARELGIPCVNGVRNAADLLTNGQVVTVDGHLGIVTVGEPEFDLELRNRAAT
jgi:pyruvate,water dikinase